MKTSTKLLSRITVLCGAVLLASTTFALGSDALETGAFTSANKTAMVDFENDQVDPLQMTVTPFVQNNGGVNIRCNGDASGSASCTTTGGTAPFTYSWSHDAAITSNQASQMFAGNYSVTVTDAAGSSVTQSYTLTQNPALVAGVSATDILCNGGSSTVTTSATGGTPPYFGTNTYTATPGTYSYNIIDANYCRSGVALTITEPDILTATATPTAILCYGEMSDVTVSGTGGTLPYGGAAGVIPQLAGVYEYNVIDANGCTDNVTLAINQPGKLVSSATRTDIACYGERCQVLVSVTSGTEPYSGDGLYTDSAGVRVYQVYDFNGCPDSVILNIDQPAMLVANATATMIDCNGGTSTVTVSATGGTSPYGADLGDHIVGAGTYTYSVSDTNTCTESVSITVSEPAVLSATISSTTIACNGETSDVTIVATGGSAPYTGAGTFSVGAGTHTFAVTDINGCSVNVSTTVTEPGAITASAVATGTIQCYGETTDVVVSATGGSAPYTGTGTISNVTSGTNTYIVTDATGCSVSTDLTISGGGQIIPNISPSYQIIDCIPDPVTFAANPTGGVAPYTYLWSNGETTASISVNPDYTTVYEVTITDANGCDVSTTNGATVQVMNRCGNGNKKIVICHVPSGNGENPQTICISPNALDPHMLDAWNLHGGDYCGPCQTTMALALDETNNGDNNFVRVAMNTNNETVEVSYRLAYDSEVSVEIYDMTGALVEVIHQGRAEEGQMYDVVVIPSKFTSGVYIYQFITDVERHIDKLQFIH